MTILKAKDFIQQVFIDELGVLATKNYYISFAIMATGIEFLGKCLDSTAPTWNVPFRSGPNFKLAINTLSSFITYRPHADLLFDSLRCGFAHSFVPKYDLTLSSQNEATHMVLQNNRLNLKCEDFYADFKNACLEVINMPFSDPNDKMNKDLLEIPVSTFNAPGGAATAATQSKA